MITATPVNGDNAYQFGVWEFPNGAIMVPYEITDRFFDSRDQIQCGDDRITEILETPVTFTFDNDELRRMINTSEEAGKVRELLAT